MVDLGWRAMLAAAVAAGVALGVFSVLGDGVIRVRLVTILGNLGSPWGLAAFGIGLITTSRLRGAVGSTLLLLVGSATYAVPAAMDGYGPGTATLGWAAVAVIFGPLMGCCGAAVSRRRPRPPIIAVAAPSVMLVGEAVFFLWERRVWSWNLQAEPHRLADLGIAVGFIALAVWLPALLVQGRTRLTWIYVLALVGGWAAAGAFLVTYRWILLR